MALINPALADGGSTPNFDHILDLIEAADDAIVIEGDVKKTSYDDIARLP